MKPEIKNEKRILYGFFILAAVLLLTNIASLIWLGMLSKKVQSLNGTVNFLGNSLASTTVIVNEVVNSNSTLRNALSSQMQNVGNIQQQLGGFQNQFSNLSGTLNNLQKLSKTDPELLKKYSKVYFLNENYVPAHLSEVNASLTYSNTKKSLFESEALPYLEVMLRTASTSGINIYVYSAYRSFAEQRALKGQYTMVYGAGTANSFSADQGYSEHQLGTAVDLITPGLGGVVDGFDKTVAYSWLIQNAYRFGFILSYPKNNTYYTYEPWHWRFVGVKLATDLHNMGMSFYDMDQRTIDNYLVSIFD